MSSPKTQQDIKQIEKNGKADKKQQVHFSVTKILQSPMQVAFLTFALITLGIFIPFTKACIDFIIRVEKNKPEGYVFPKASDFWMTGVAALCFAAIELIICPIAGKLYEPICKEQKNLELRALKLRKMGDSTYKIIYFIWATWWGY